MDSMFKTIGDMYGNKVIDENANKDSKIIPTKRDLLAGAAAKAYALEAILPRPIADAHESGDLHFHDLDYSPYFPMFNCMLIDLEGMLTNGFKMGNAEIETPKSISTATAITAQVVAQCASHIYGGTTINGIDTILAPYVRASYNKNLAFALHWLKGDEKKSSIMALEMTEKETYDAFQALEYEVNTLHTSNGQTPFISIGFGLGTDWEHRLIQKSILQVRMKGLGKSQKTAIFPKLIFAIKKGLNFAPGDVNYSIKKLALECAAKRMYPDILNYDKNVEVTGGFKYPMGCRSFLGEYDDQHAGRNNLGVVSINLPRIAILGVRDAQRLGVDRLELFWQLLSSRAELCREALEVRINSLKNIKASVAPILYIEGACGVRLEADQTVDHIFKNGRASISLGYIGLHETVMILLGFDSHTFDDIEKQRLAKNIISKLAEIVNQWKQETGYGFSLYSTPSESLCDRFCRLDEQKFGRIPEIHNKGYYTNSFHLDVAKKVTAFEKIDFETGFAELATGGHISFVELPNMKHNLKGLERIWDYTYERIPYFGTNTPADCCVKCGFEGEALATAKGFECPHCGNRDSQSLSVIRRVCGYLGSPNSRPFNRGKQSEAIRRVKHD